MSKGEDQVVDDGRRIREEVIRSRDSPSAVISLTLFPVLDFCYWIKPRDQGETGGCILNGAFHHCDGDAPVICRPGQLLE